MNTRLKSKMVRFGPAVLFALFVSVWAVLTPAEQGAAPQSSDPARNLTAGQIAYRKAFTSYYTNFRMLADPRQTKEFARHWGHRYDAIGSLATEAETESAIAEMAKIGSRYGCPEKFDGRCLFERARRAYLRFHYNLGEPGTPDLSDPKQRDAWSTMVDGLIDPHLLETEEGTYAAIRQMRDTLHKPFDYVNSPVMTKVETTERAGHFPGIGVPVEVTNVEKNRLGGQFHLFFGRPQAGSPLFGKVKLGDMVVAVNGVNLDGAVIEEAKKRFVGKPGERIKLTMMHDQQSALYEVETAFSCPPDTPQCTEASLGIDMGLTHLNEIKFSEISQMVAHVPSEGSPAAGKIMDGDIFIAVDKVPVDGLTLGQAVDRIHGAVNTPVVLTVRRKDASGTVNQIDVTVVRQVIEKHAVHFTALPDGIGLVELDQFESLNVPTDFAVAIARTVLPLAQKALEGKTDSESTNLVAQFKSLGEALARGAELDDTSMRIVMKARDVYDELGQGGGFILDLTHNPGGEMGVFLELAGEILPEGLVVSVHQRELGGDRVIIHEDSLTPAFALASERPEGRGLERAKIEPKVRVPLLLPKKLPFKVLVGPRTASAAELTAGMLQAHRRAVLIGQSLPDRKRRPSTLGKGSGQASVPLPYGYSLHVTYLEFYPGGEKSNGRGLIADLDAETVAAQRELAVAEIKKDNLALADRIEDLKAASSRNRELLDGAMRDREAEDRKPLADQNPEMFK